jgi:hypothetical protein
MTGSTKTLEIEPGAALDALRSDCVNITLAQQDERFTVQLDFPPVLWFEKDPVPLLNRSDIRPDADDLSPDQPLTHLRSSRNDYSAGRTTFAIGALLFDKDPIVKQFNRE